jgi:hypothetical protein
MLFQAPQWWWQLSKNAPDLGFLPSKLVKIPKAAAGAECDYFHSTSTGTYR